MAPSDAPHARVVGIAEGRSLSKPWQSRPGRAPHRRVVRTSLIVRFMAPTILFFTTGMAFADSDQASESRGAESVGDDLTNPVNRMELLNRWSEAYGRGVAPHPGAVEAEEDAAADGDRRVP